MERACSVTLLLYDYYILYYKWFSMFFVILPCDAVGFLA